MPLIRKPSKAPPAVTADAPLDVNQGLSSANPDERWAAARAGAQAPQGTEALASALRTERDSRVREAMFTSLARIGSSQSVSYIVEFIRSDDASLRAAALDALRAKPEPIRVHLPALLNDRDSDVRILSCELARSLPSEEATTVLSELLAREDQPNVCAAAIDVLAEAGRPEALSTLEACAVRFKDTPFLIFAIKIAKERIKAQSIASHD
jgi:HEAT repeat protein